MKKDRVPELHFYEWSVSAWLSSETRDRLDATGRGIYRELLDTCYTQGTFPDDRDWICRRCACTIEQYETVWPLIEKHFPISNRAGYRWLVRANIVRREYRLYIAKQKANRKKGVESAREWLHKTRSNKQLDDGGSTKKNSGQFANQPNGNGNTTATQPNGNGNEAPPPLPCLTEYPETTAAIRAKLPSTDDVFVLRLVQETAQKAISADIPTEQITDRSIALAVAQSFRDGPPTMRAGLLLTMVPQTIKTWAKQKALEPETTGTYINGLPAEEYMRRIGGQA